MNVLIDIPDVSLCLIENGSPMCDILLNCIKDGYFIPEDITNGGLIRIMFPNAEIDANPYSPSVDIFVDGILMMRVDRNWWNAPYGRGGK